MKYATALFVTAALGLGAAQPAPVSASAPASAASQPQNTAPNAAPSTTNADPSLSPAAITIETGRYQGPLSSLLGAIAQAAGYELVLEVNVDTLAASGGEGQNAQAARPVAYSFRNKPFNEVWPLLMDVYGLNYEIVRLGDQQVIRVNNTLTQRVVDLEAADPNYVVGRAEVFFGSVTSRFQNQSTSSANGNASSQGTTTSNSQGGQSSSTSNGSASGSADSKYGANSVIYNNKFETESLKVIADNVGKKVIIRGYNKEVRDVERFVRSLDQAAVAQRREQLSRYGNAVNSNKREIYIANNGAGNIGEFLSNQYPALSVTVLPNSAGLLIEGNTAVVDDALALLRQIDPAPGQITQRVFQLVNASADDLATTLMVTLARDLTANGNGANTGNTAATSTNGNTGTGTNGNNNSGNTPVNVNVGTASPSSAAAPRADMATILPDARTNTLIVRGTPAQVAQIAELIPTLDRAVPQINLQVRIQEITESAQRSLGVDWRAGFGGFNVGLISSGSSPTGLTASFDFDPTRSLVGFNIFPTLNALETQSQAKRVYDGVITMQSGQRSLGSSATNGSRNASDTAAASIKSGGKLELNIPGGDGKTIEKVIDYGVILDFFEPTVAPDGTITLRVRGQVNDLQNQDAITPGALPYLLRFSNSEAQTRISFKPGETVLLSGLLGTTENNTKAGLPFLSMIPGLGAAAGNQATNRNSTQMLFIITGDIVN
ncbi:type II secretion system protein GspD [Deinococcus sp. Marseille-Q6407]|uniref:type II secretion system protein GspD n=1 Tax=Deinococcus sp. Marseille-Q6407 TaxID=2969223 RepID=UPI0021C2110F|nr:secretin N-terminal domain-containing protein [Deinococcus sp. Marseille-Q6407]